MLNKLNTLLASTVTTRIQEIKTTTYLTSADLKGETTDFIVLPAGISQGSLGLLFIGSKRGNSTNSTTSQLGIPTGFTLIDKLESGQSSGRNSTQGLFYKYMTASDSSTTISTLFTNNRAEDAIAIFIEVILNKNINIKGFDDLTNIGSGSPSAVATLTNVPSVVTTNSPFFLLTFGVAGGGGSGITVETLLGGMQLYDTSETILTTGADLQRYILRLFKYDNILIKDLPSTEDAIYTASNDAGATPEITAGVYIICMK